MIKCRDAPVSKMRLVWLLLLLRALPILSALLFPLLLLIESALPMLLPSKALLLLLLILDSLLPLSGRADVMLHSSSFVMKQ